MVRSGVGGRQALVKRELAGGRAAASAGLAAPRGSEPEEAGWPRAQDQLRLSAPGARQPVPLAQDQQEGGKSLGQGSRNLAVGLGQLTSHDLSEPFSSPE